MRKFFVILVWKKMFSGQIDDETLFSVQHNHESADEANLYVGMCAGAAALKRVPKVKPQLVYCIARKFGSLMVRLQTCKYSGAVILHSY